MHKAGVLPRWRGFLTSPNYQLILLNFFRKPIQRKQFTIEYSFIPIELQFHTISDIVYSIG